jgi:tetratricopeptide (TPR) repeat protein
VQHGSLAAHETLDAAIGWSVDLLADQERRLLLRLWAFEGGFTLEAAETVSPDSASPDVLESLSALVTRSVVVADTSVEPTRYLLLESIRAYCRRLDPDPAATAEVQAAWVRLLAGRCTEAIRGRRAGLFMRMMSRELPNFRAGFAHDLEHHPAAALESAVGLGVFLYRSLHHGEAVKVLRTAIAAAPDGPALDRARALNSLTALSYFAGDLDAARELIETVYRMLPSLSPGDYTPIEYAELCFFLAVGCAVTGQIERTREVTGKVIEHGDRDELAGMVRAARSVLGVALLKEAARTGDEAGMVAQIEAMRHEFSRGWSRAWPDIAVAEVYLRYPAVAPDSAEKALAAVRSAVATFLSHEDYPYALNILQVGALALDRAGRPDDAARLLGAVQAHARRLGLRTPGLLEPERPWVEEALGEPVAGELSWQAMVALLGAGELQAETATLGP